jgi:hypothetical protein
MIWVVMVEEDIHHILVCNRIHLNNGTMMMMMMMSHHNMRKKMILFLVQLQLDD